MSAGNVPLYIPRSNYIGGADASTILGRNDYKSRRKAWLLKRGILPDVDLSQNPHVRRGEFMEPMVEQWIYENLDPTINDQTAWNLHDKATGERRIPQRFDGAQIMLLDTDHLHPLTGKPFIGGHPDGVGREVLWEIKAPTTYKLDRIIREGAPPEWLYQIQHYLMLTGLPQGALVIWDSDRWTGHVTYVEPNLDLFDIMRTEYEDFWTHVQNGTEPTDGTLAQDQQVLVVHDNEIDRLLGEYKAAYEQRYRGDDLQKKIRMELMTKLQGRGAIITDNWSAKISRSVGRTGNDLVRLTVTANKE